MNTWPPPSYLDAEKHRPLTKEESRSFIPLTMIRDEIVPAAELDAKVRGIFGDELADSFFVQVMIKRLVAMRPDLSYSPYALVWCAVLSDRVGVAVQWTYTMVDFNRRKGHPMTIKSWVDSFPWGPPPEPEQHRIWDLQKKPRSEGDYDTDNMLDDREAWAEKHTTIS